MDYFDSIKAPWSRPVGPEDQEDYRAAKLLAGVVREETWRLKRAISTTEVAAGLSSRPSVLKTELSRPTGGTPSPTLLTYSLDKAEALGLVQGRARLGGEMVWSVVAKEKSPEPKGISREGVEWRAGV